jgi:hypothetical protein
VAYDQVVLTPVVETAPPTDLSMSTSDADVTQCSRQEHTVQRCQDPTWWVKTASGTCCTLLRQQLSSMKFDGPCAGSTYLTIRFECCPSTLMSPTATCEPRTLSSVGDCLDYNVWRARAERACAEKGRIVSMQPLKLLNYCGPGRARGVEFECCALPCATGS